MIVFDLICSNQHAFEGWFASAGEFSRQQETGMLLCPVCRDRSVAKRPSPVRFSRQTGAGESPGETAGRSPETVAVHVPRIDLQQVLDFLLVHTEDVGVRFADEARRIHHGESEMRGIRGQAEPVELAALEDEGIEVFQFPIPPKSDWN
jgi:hypothetical protein